VKQITVALNETLHRRLKAEAALRGLRIVDALEAAVQTQLDEWSKEDGDARQA